MNGGRGCTPRFNGLSPPKRPVIGELPPHRVVMADRQTGTLPKLYPGKRLWDAGFPLRRFADRGYRSSSKSAPSASALVRGGHLGHPLRRRGSAQSPRRAEPTH